MAAPRPVQVIKDNIGLRPERYDGYHADLVSLLNDALTAVGDGAGATQRRRDLVDAIKAKASTIGKRS